MKSKVEVSVKLIIEATDNKGFQRAVEVAKKSITQWSCTGVNFSVRPSKRSVRAYWTT